MYCSLGIFVKDSLTGNHRLHFTLVTNAFKKNFRTGKGKTFRIGIPCARRRLAGHDIAYSAAFRAPHMAMWSNIAVKPFLRSATFKAEDLPLPGQKFQIPVYSAQAYFGKLLAGHRVNFIRSWMRRKLTQFLKNNRSLFCCSRLSFHNTTS